MSTYIKEIIGRKEERIIPGPSIYVDSRIDITRFWGGKVIGRMLQISISNNDGHSYIQLTRDQVVDLSKTLLDAFDGTIYPSE